ncbi:CLUMA_CG017158, isoform A [Clunio marinus]|uniref:CLUMA_CG017158, isoform A n=1 Tax=Clunio marinus TaxID=568069 RepID=A0A1J1IUX0_9DIPT|nr:CLUMA_CG017158, isoform A [Clunio marinus]
MDRSGILVLLMILSSVSVNGKLHKSITVHNILIFCLPCNIAPGIQVCPRNLPNMADCIIKSIRKLQPSLVSGDLGGGFVVPPLEPFKIAKANMNDLKFDFIVFFPTLEIRGKYDLVFKLYGNDFDGDGKFLSAFENRRARIGMRASTVQVCSRHDPNIAKCIIESVRNLQPRLADGVLAPDFRVPPLEPLKLDNMHIDRGPNFQVRLSNMIVTKGASNFKIEKLKVNVNEPSFDFIIHLPRIEFKGKYDLKIRVVVVDLVGKNDIYGRLDDFKARVKVRGRKYEKNGQTYMKFEKIQLKIIVGRSNIELKNLFENNPTLGKVGNGFISENSAYFVSEIIPSLEKNLSEIFTKTANSIIETSTFDEMFPE